MNLNIWLDIPSKYIGYFCVIVSDAADIFSEGLTDHLLRFFSLRFFGISLAIVEINVKNVLLKNLFFKKLAFLFLSVSFVCYVKVGFCF